MRNERGTILVSGLGFMGIFLVCIFVLMFTLGLIQEKRNSLNYCRKVTVENLKVIKSTFKQLRYLNPMALLLRTQWTEVNLAIIAAQALLPESLPILQKLILRRNLIERQRQNLDQTQKFLLKNVSAQNQIYRLAMIAGPTETLIHRVSIFGNLGTQNQSKQSLLFYRQTFSNFTLVSAVAMVPDLPDIAPAYEPASNFTERTILAAYWQSEQIRDNQWLKEKTELTVWDDGCAFYLTPRNFSIRPQRTSAVKHSLKPSY